MATLTGVLINNVGVTAFGSAGTIVAAAAAAGAVGATGPIGEILAGRSHPVNPTINPANTINFSKFLLKVITLFPFLPCPVICLSQRYVAGLEEMDGKVRFSSRLNYGANSTNCCKKRSTSR